jgi:protein-arginine kinase activator protein McsA
MEWEKETFSSPDGRITYIVTTGTMGAPRKNKNSLESLKQQLETAVNKEDFQLAIYLRDKIKTFEKDQEEIKKIEDELKECIKSQNFEKAIELRDQLQKMRP